MAINKRMYDSYKVEKKLADVKKEYRKRWREEQSRKYREMIFSEINKKGGDK